MTPEEKETIRKRIEENKILIKGGIAPYDIAAQIENKFLNSLLSLSPEVPKSVEERAQELYPTVDVLPKETGYNENDVAEKQQAAYIQGSLDSGKEAVEWIDVKERLPEIIKMVIIWTTVDTIPTIGYYTGDDWFYFNGSGNFWLSEESHIKVLFWMPLPLFQKRDGK